jgi:hypothetical protein
MSDLELSDDKAEGRHLAADSYTKTLSINSSQRTNSSGDRPWPLREEEDNNKMPTGWFSDHKDSRPPTPRSTYLESHLEDKDENKKEGEESERVYPGWKIIIPVMLSLYIVLFLVALVSLANPRVLAPSSAFQLRIAL